MRSFITNIFLGKRLACFLLLVFSSLLMQEANAQSKVSGRVTNSAGEPLVSATITNKTSKQTTLTNEQGEFTIAGKNGDKLEISYAGMETLAVTVSGSSPFEIKLSERSAIGDEVIVVGYGTQKKINLTGAVEVVKGAELVNRPTATLSQALQGKVSGINFSTGTFGFEPGAALNIQIRGQGAPLILIDGVPSSSLNGLNPNDVESMSILKDAAAAAIYGARAPYGVVLITTKSGASNNKLSIEYSANYSKIKPIRMPHHADSYTTALALNEASVNSGITPIFTNGTIDRILAYNADPTNTPETVPSATNPSLWANVFESNANHDWFNIYYGNGRRYQQNLSVSGGNKGMRFYLSGGIVDDGGILQIGKDNYRRYNTTAKFDANLTKWMKFSSNTRYYNTSRNTPAYDNQGNYDLLFHHIARTFPSQYLKSPNGVYSIQSKVPWTRDAGNENTTTNDVVQRFATEIAPLKGWTINADYTLQLTINQFKSDNYTVYEDNVAGGPVVSGSTAIPFVAESQDLNFYKTANIYSTYKFTVADKHDFSVMAGYQQEKSKYSYLSARKTNLITPTVPAISTSTGTIDATDALSSYATEGLFARINYNYDNKYLLELNGRYDGTYKFAEGKRWGFFPSVSAGWNVSNENFWENVKHYVNAFKIRASLGSLGNQLTAAAYQDLPLLGISSNLPWIISGVRPSYTTAPNLINPEVTWETSKTKNIGFDLAFFNNRLNVTADIYQRLSFDQLGPSQAVPAVIGVTSLPQSNNQETKTNGWEFSLNWKDKIGGDFRYSVTAMLFDYQTTITKYNNPTKILTNPYAGQKQGAIWGFVSDGLIATQSEADAINTNLSQKAISGQVWKTGDVKYMDLNKDGLITFGANTADDPGDRRKIGNLTPRYQFGLTLHTEWKGFDFSMFWQGVGKRDLMLSGNMFWGFSTAVQSSIFPGHLNYYRDADADKYKGLGMNKEAYFPRPYLDGSMNAKNQITQTRYLQNGAYARLKNMQLGYNMPELILRKTKLQNIYLFVSGENLATITKMPEHFDPETANVGSRGNGKSYFSQAALTFGINLKF